MKTRARGRAVDRAIIIMDRLHFGSQVSYTNHSRPNNYIFYMTLLVLTVLPVHIAGTSLRGFSGWPGSVTRGMQEACVRNTT